MLGGSPLKLDTIDQRIIYALTDSARKPIRDIAKELGLSRPTVNKRIRDLLSKGIISFNVGLNIKALGFRTAEVGLRVKGTERAARLVKGMSRCPRVLLLKRPSGRVNLSLYLYGETINVLESMIESLRALEGVEVAFVCHSEPPEHPRTLFARVWPKKANVVPCGRDLPCRTCHAFKEDRCLACPAIKGYQAKCSACS